MGRDGQFVFLFIFGSYFPYFLEIFMHHYQNPMFEFFIQIHAIC